MYATWKDNWEESKKHYEKWWKREGLIVSTWGGGLPGETALRKAAEPAPCSSLEQKYTDPRWIAASEHHKQAFMNTPLDILPIAFPDIGTVSLAPMLGAVPSLAESNIWYEPDGDFGPESDRKLVFDRDAKWWRVISEAAKAVKEISGGNYFTGLPAVCPNLDVLAEIRGTENLMMDLILAPDWVHEKLSEIEDVFESVYKGLYDIIKEEDGSSVMGYFMVWAPGMVCLAQCDTAAMISEDMFREFVIPPLQRQCDFLDYSLYHVDGPMALKTVDAILEVDSLDAVEYTPGPNVPDGGDPHWFDLYRKIKDAEKSVQIAGVKPEEVLPILDTLGPEGTYLLVNFPDMKSVEAMAKEIESYR